MTLQQRTSRRRKVRVKDRSPGRERFLRDVLAGLQRPRKELPSKYFYDAEGSALFERICDLDEYYLTRTELAIMDAHVEEIAAALGTRCLLIEYGAGSGRKTRLLLDHLRDPAAYVPIDISRATLSRLACELGASFPDLEVLPVVADYTAPLTLPASSRMASRRSVYYPGSTIGNFYPHAATEFLAHIGDLVGGGGGLLIGVDLEKDRSVLEAAYNDREGVTAAFNLNLLVRVNRELGADFRVGRFRHMAVYSEDEGRIEMHLVSTSDQCVCIGGQQIPFEKDETIFTECSYKYSLERFRDLALEAGLKVRKVWTDPKRYFSVQYLTTA
jgi:dimethylhistidine N-methyltransferase